MNSYLTDSLQPSLSLHSRPISCNILECIFKDMRSWRHSAAMKYGNVIIKNKAEKNVYEISKSCVWWWEKREKSSDQQPSKSQMDFYVPFHNLMFQFLAKKSLLLSAEKNKVFAQHWTTTTMRWREEEAKESFLRCFFLFPYGVSLKSSLESFLSCCWKIIDKINWQYKFNLCRQPQKSMIEATNNLNIKK